MRVHSHGVRDMETSCFDVATATLSMCKIMFLCRYSWPSDALISSPIALSPTSQKFLPAWESYFL